MLQIHEKIEQARVSAGLTQDEMAEKLGIKRSTYQYWEQKTPSQEKVERVAKALDLPIGYFFEGVVSNDEKILAHDATLSVLLDEISSLKADLKGGSPIVERKRIEKAIADVAALMKASS